MTPRKYHTIKLAELRRGNLAVLDHLGHMMPGDLSHHIIKNISKVMGVPMKEVKKATTRKPPAPDARRVGWLILRDHYRLTYEEIGIMIGGLGRVAVFQGIERLRELLKYDRDLKEKYSRVLSYLERF